MFIKKSHFKAAAVAFSLLSLSTSSGFAKHCDDCDDHHHHHEAREAVHGAVIPAQANYQDEAILVATVDLAVPFTIKNFKKNFSVNPERTVFEVKVPGLYSLDSYLLVNLPNIGDSVGGYITINGRRYLTFFSRETRLLDPVVELHFGDRYIYLEKGDRISVVLSEAPLGTTVLGRGFVAVAFNNSLECSH